MTNDEIDEGIMSNPGGSDLEVALAIGCDEGDVKRRRSAMVAKVAKEETQRKLYKEDAERALKARVVKSPPPRNDIPAQIQLPSQRYFIKDLDTNQLTELVRLNKSKTIVIFQTMPLPF
jgi:hypothetical protein